VRKPTCGSGGKGLRVGGSTTTRRDKKEAARRWESESARKEGREGYILEGCNKKLRGGRSLGKIAGGKISLTLERGGVSKPSGRATRRGDLEGKGDHLAQVLPRVSRGRPIPYSMKRF